MQGLRGRLHLQDRTGGDAGEYVQRAGPGKHAVCFVACFSRFFVCISFTGTRSCSRAVLRRPQGGSVRRARASERDCLTFFRRAIHLSSLARCSALRYSSSAFCHCALSVSRSSCSFSSSISLSIKRSDNSSSACGQAEGERLETPDQAKRQLHRH
jgi:hypothetical protein